MRKTTLFSLFALFFLVSGSSVRADELFYTLVTEPFPTGPNHTSYNDYFDDEHDGIVWNAPGNQSLDGIWRIGGKSLDQVDRTITSKTPMGSSISSVIVNHNGTSRNQVTVNSMKLTVASDVDYTDIIDEVVLTPSISTEVAGSVEFTPESVTVWDSEAYYRLTINLSNTSTSNGGLDLTSIAFYAPDESGTVTVAKPVITPGSGTYTEPFEVSITADEGCSIFYTTNGIDPDRASTPYTEPFTVETDTWVKAIAYDQDGNASKVAEAIYSFPAVVPSIARLCVLASQVGDQQVIASLDGWIVTGIRGKNAYFTDGANGILLYEDGNGFEVGDKLAGTALVNLTNYNGAPEITGLKTTSEGLTIAAKGVEISPMEVNIANLDNSHQGNLITVKGVTYDDKKLVDADGNAITPYNTFSIEMPEWKEGETYNVTGVFIWFKDTKEIAPRSSSDIAVASATGITAPVISPAGGTYTEPQAVTITAEEGFTIKYTLDGTDPLTSATAILSVGNTVTIELSENTTVRAVATNADGDSSEEAVADFTFVSDTDAIASIGRLCPLATEEEQSVLVRFNEWIVTGVNGAQVYFTDGVNGIVGYQSGHNFELGDKITGSAVITLVLYQGCAEVKGLTSTTEGVTVEKGAEAVPLSVSIASLQKDMQGCLIHFDGVTVADGVFVDDDDNTITPYNAFKLSDYTKPLEGKTYNITGVAIWYEKDGVWEIAPRTAEEFELVTTQVAPESSWNVEEEVVDIEGASEAVFTTTSDGTVTYTSSNEAVATIDADGNITIVGRGITVITASVAETQNYLADSKSFTLTVTKDGYTDATFAYTDEDILNQGFSGGGEGFSATRGDVLTLTFTNAFGAAQHIKVYGSGANDIENSNVELRVAEGYAITDVVFNITGDKDYRSVWVDQFGDEANYVDEDSLSVVWKGFQNEVILNNLMNTHTQRAKQARIRTINVTYVKLIDTGKTVTIGESGYATFCSEADVIVSNEGDWALAGAVVGFGGTDGTVLSVDTLGTSIPATAGVVLIGAPGEYKVYTHQELSARPIQANLLVGVLTDTEVEAGNYVFDEENGVAAFRAVEEATATVPAGQAYLPVPPTGSVPAYFFTEADYETGIRVQTAQQGSADAIYNLAGQRLSKMQQGVNIVGGKKILK